ncbi:MAG: hypothetical protein A2Y64_05375 [Candidatus Coatesbacteria bacterium RBG_13_66_14]|uniref:DUF306 domain-containing protein n=1 Tax=Candidatus Coatesbacteria bacterium RBG_13_66_14 TaxID=1817816 RepID=A0A1F5F7F4_9BACT|nr:MAG: hypothetical protein A2Y64_05375 [Candidatus Coatesbacteria bacterium RBG_13_66_14]
MKRGLLLMLPAVVSVLIPGCAGGTGGDGDDNPYEADTLSEAREIAAPLAGDWDAGAFCFNIIGLEVDSDGVLRGPDSLAGGDDKWFFRFNDGGDRDFNVCVHYDGAYETSEDGSSETCHPLPEYSDGHVKDLMNTSDDAFQENLDPADYFYMLDLLALECSNTATVQAYETDYSLAGWLVMDADTLDILDTSW